MKAKRRTTLGTPAMLVLARSGTPHRVHTFAHDSRSDLGFGKEAAAALGVEPARVFKTLMVAAGQGFATAVVPVNASLDLRAVASALRVKAVKMATISQAERVTGYVAGGISPIGQRYACPTIIDNSAKGCETLFVSGGARGLDVELSPHDLAALTGARFAAIARADRPM